jgi:uncharacterized membrane protein YozB (DUF420 family)
MSGTASTKSIIRAVIVAGIVAGFISFFVIPGPMPQFYRDSSLIVLLGTWLIDILEFMTVIILTLAGGALGLAFLKRTERKEVDGRSASMIAGAITAIVFAIMYISINTATGNTRMANGALDFICPSIFGLVEFLLAGFIGGVAAVRLTRQSISSPSHLVRSSGLAGVLAGLYIALFMAVYDSLVLWINYFYAYVWDSLPYYFFKILWITVLITLLTLGSGIIYAWLAGEPKPGPSGPATMAATM